MEFTHALPMRHPVERSTGQHQSVRRRLIRWLETLGDHIARHGWADPTGAVTPPPRLEPDRRPVDADAPVLEHSA